MAIDPNIVERVHYYERRAVPKYPYWYGMKKALYTSVGLPEWKPVSCHLQHGVGMWLERQRPDVLTLESPYPVIFVENAYQVNLCKEFDDPRLDRPTYPIGSIFPRYRKFRGIERRPDAKGSLVYPSHSAELVAAEVNWEVFIEEYKQLPAKYHPLTISIYFKDYLKGVHEIFLKAGFDVVMAGHMSDPNFVDHFYDILPRFKYVIGNDYGSYLYYALDMGIPCFFHGTAGRYMAKAEERNQLAASYELSDFQNFRIAYKLFTPTIEELEEGVCIKPEQQAFADQIMGVKEALPSETIKAVLEQHETKYYLKELALAPAKIPLRLWRELKARRK